MVDVGLAPIVVEKLNRWYRRRAKPRGTTDHFYRGVRMSYDGAFRATHCCMSLFLLSLAGFLFFVPDALHDESPQVVLLLKLGWIVITIVALAAPVQAFREFVIVNDEGLLKSDLFGRKTQLAWKDIAFFSIKPNDNTVILLTVADSKFKMNLAYDGWQDFWEIAAKHVEPVLYHQMFFVLAGVNKKHKVSGSTTRQNRFLKWFQAKQK